MTLRRISLLAMLCCCRPIAAAELFDPTREFIRSELIERSVPSIAVAVARNGRIVWEEGFGWADREKRVMATEHTMYSLASISKPITATGLMTLVQAGQIDLDRPANDYLGRAKLRAHVGEASGATIRRVANHTSGLPRHYQFFYADEPYSRPSMDETILRYGDLVTASGERYEYSNLGYGVLDYIIERQSGVSYAQFMRTEVFLPLGMTHTSVNIGPGLESYAATRYGMDGLPLPFYDFDHPGASAVFSSAHDLIRFAMFHLKAHLRDQKAILSDALIDEMHRRTATENENSGYGIGFDIWDRDGYHVISHNGGMAGVTTSMRLFPRENLAVVVLSNSSSSLPKEISNRIVSRLLPQWTPSRRKDLRSSAFVPTESLLGQWRGTLSTYEKELPVQLVFLSDGDVRAKIGDQPETLVGEPRFSEGLFQGTLSGRIGTPDTEHYDYTIGLALTLRGDVLNGSASAMGEDYPRLRNMLTHWIELQKGR